MTWGLDCSYNWGSHPGLSGPALDKCDSGIHFYAGKPSGTYIYARLNKHWTTTALVYSSRNQVAGDSIRVTGSGEHTYLNDNINGGGSFWPSNSGKHYGYYINLYLSFLSCVNVGLLFLVNCSINTYQLGLVKYFDHLGEVGAVGATVAVRTSTRDVGSSRLSLASCMCPPGGSSANAR